MEFSSHCPEGSLTTCTFRIGGKPGQKNLAQPRLTGQESADELGKLAAAAKARDLDSLGQVSAESLERIHWLYRRAIAEKMSVAVRENNDVAGHQLFAPSILQFGIGAPFGQEVEDDQVPGARGEKRRDRG